MSTRRPFRPGQPVTWQRPAPGNRWPPDGDGIIHTDHGRTVTLTDGTILLRREITTQLIPYWKATP